MEEGKELLTAGAYWLLTQIEKAFGLGTQAAAKTLNLSDNVLRRLRQLATVDDPVLGAQGGQ